MIVIFCILLLLIQLVHGFIPASSIKYKKFNLRNLKLGIDVSSLPIVPDYQNSLATTSTDGISNIINLPQGDTYSDIQNALILLGGIVYIIYEKRPRGSARIDLLDIKKSTIAGANLGVFAKSFIAAGTTLGVFPGYIRNIDDALELKIDDNARNKAKKYIWSVIDNKIIDPTNKYGILEMELSYFFGLVKVNTMLARINEPPPQKDVNVYTKITSNGVEVIAERDIFADEEVFIDYGSKYDRSDYADEKINEQNKNDAEKKKLEDEMLKIQPIISIKDNKNIDQDTSMPEGFISKLNKQDSSFNKAGIISPDEGANMYNELGVNMFANDEDKELINSLLGKTKDPTIITNINNDKKKNEDKKRVVITPEEASKLQDKLDSLSDEQIEKVFAKMKTSLSEKMKENIEKKLEYKTGNISFPKSKVVDKSIREKYNKELTIVEDELGNSLFYIIQRNILNYNL